MTTKILTGTYVSGYAMVPPTTVVSITATGYVEGAGVASPPAGTGAYRVVNAGRIEASGIGVYLYSGGSVTNGATNVATAQIAGGIGVVVGEKSGTVVNFATIRGLGVADGGAEGNGVILSQGGVVTNGSAKDIHALIAGATAVAVYGEAGTIGNFASLEGTAAPPDGRVVYLGAGGRLTNGAANDTTAFIGGDQAQGFIDDVDAKRAAATVTNFGAIIGAQPDIYDSSTGQVNLYYSTAIDLEAGGRVTNGTATDTSAYITATYGIVIGADRGTVVNKGVITSYFYESHYVPPSGGYGGYTGVYRAGVAVSLAAGGLVDNGTAADTGAIIFAEVFGVAVSGAAGTVRNFATIEATAAPNSTAVYLAAGGSVTNGGPTDHAALIAGGNYGVLLAGAGVVTNFGTISAATAVRFTSSAARLVVEAGSLFVGYVGGAGGTLELNCGAGSIAQIAIGDLTVHGALPTENFSDFGVLEIAKGTQITLDGYGEIEPGGTSTLDVLGTFIVTASLATHGKVIGAGTLDLAGGQTHFGSSTSLTVSHVTVGGGAVVAATNLTYAGAWAQTAGTVSIDSGDKLTFDGVGDAFSGTLTGAGTVAFSKGSDTFSALTLSAAHQKITGSTVTLTGAVALGATLTVATPDLIVATAGASLTGGGTLLLTDNAANAVRGASAGARLTNVGDKIQGAGQLGGGEMVLFNDAAGTIDGQYATGLTLDTGTRTIVNSGLIEATGAGLVTIQSALTNNGTLYASGRLTVNAAVGGTGVARIVGGVADFTSTFTQAVTFATSGELELAHSQAYAGTISGFSKTGATSLDLGDIAFGAKTKASFSGTTASGVLTVTDGTHTSTFTLIGNYTASTFDVASDGHGGTTVVDPPAGPAASPVQLVAAMAGFGRDAALSTTYPSRPTPTLPLLLRQP